MVVLVVFRTSLGKLGSVVVWIIFAPAIQEEGGGRSPLVNYTATKPEVTPYPTSMRCHLRYHASDVTFEHWSYGSAALQTVIV